MGYNFRPYNPSQFVETNREVIGVRVMPGTREEFGAY